MAEVSTTIADPLSTFASFLQDLTQPWVTGSISVPQSDTTIYVKDQKISFPFPSKQDLEQLYNHAQPASFGRGQESVLDPTYRSARTIVSEDFAINLRPSNVMLNNILTLMTPTADPQAFVRAQLYRINIYGPGDFFKEHKDTPQSESGHFGSLVFCLPTEFEGGAFAIRDVHDKEFKWDWASKYTKKGSDDQIITSEPTSPIPPAIEYVAFASDLTHWIEPVTSGYRVTVTFHLYLDSLEANNSLLQPSALAPMETNTIVQDAKAAMIDPKYQDKAFIFPLVHQYAEREGARVVLKAGDATLFQMLSRLNLKPKVMFYYDSHSYYYRRGTKRGKKDDEYCYLSEDVMLFTEVGFSEDEQAIDDLAHYYRVKWVREPIRSSVSLSVGGSYGNMPSMEEYVGNACIVIMGWDCAPITPAEYY